MNNNNIDFDFYLDQMAGQGLSITLRSFRVYLIEKLGKSADTGVLSLALKNWRKKFKQADKSDQLDSLIGSYQPVINIPDSVSELLVNISSIIYEQSFYAAESSLKREVYEQLENELNDAKNEILDLQNQIKDISAQLNTERAKNEQLMLILQNGFNSTNGDRPDEKDVGSEDVALEDVALEDVALEDVALVESSVQLDQHEFLVSDNILPFKSKDELLLVPSLFLGNREEVTISYFVEKYYSLEKPSEIIDALNLDGCFVLTKSGKEGKILKNHVYDWLFQVDNFLKSSGKIGII